MSYVWLLCLQSTAPYTRNHHRSFFFFFNDTATTEIYTLSLQRRSSDLEPLLTITAITKTTATTPAVVLFVGGTAADRKSTRLNSSHQIISYAVFCLKKKINRRRKIVLNEEHK